MQNFKFRLQKLLDIRIDEEQRCKMEFKNIQNEKIKLEDKLYGLKEDYSKYKFCDYSTSTIENKIRQNYLNLLNSSINETEDLIIDKSEEIELKREELKEKQIDKKIVETLKDKKLADFIKEQNMIEQKNNDEFALYGYIRNSMGRRG